MNGPAPSEIHPDPEAIIVPRKHGEVLIHPPLSVLEQVVRAAPAGSPWEAEGDAVWPALGVAWRAVATRAREELTEAIRTHAAATGAAFPDGKRPALPDEKPSALPGGGGQTRAGTTNDPPAELGALARPFATRPWVMTGHQVEFYHAGVWAKVVVADALAKAREDAVAIDLLVDHDVIDHLGMDLPVQRDGRWEKDNAEFGTNAALPAEALSVPDENTFARWREEIASYDAGGSDALRIVLDELERRRATAGKLPDGTDSGVPAYTAWMSAGRQALERALGINVWHVPTSLMCQGSAWFLFVEAWMRHAGPWARAYNQALAGYRRRMGIHNPQQPMPDLAITTTAGSTRVELPFWIYRRGEPRTRLVVEDAGDEMKLEYQGAVWTMPKLGGWQGGELLRGAMDVTHLHIRPRALTLTMFVRLFMADLFIHGIGGALYDQITDVLLERLFAAQGPYAVASAAWLLPLADAEAPEDLAKLKSRRHHLFHNPQLMLKRDGDQQTRALKGERAALIGRIAASLAQRRKTERPERRAWWRRLHEVRDELHALHPSALADLDERLDAVRRQERDNKVLLWREFFFALHSLASLRRFMETVGEGQSQE